MVNFCPGSGAIVWQCGGGASEDTVHRVYRIEGGGARHSRARGEDAAGADVDQADNSGDGREGLDHRERGRGFRRGGGGVVASAFGFSGQKCSACSRAIVEEPIYDAFVERLRESVAKLTVGDPAKNPNMGPVVNEAAMKSILYYVEIGKKEGRLVAGGKAVETPEKGYYVAPTVIADVAPKARIAQEEIFGPVLAVIKAKDFDHALADCQQHGVWADGRGVFDGPGEAG